MLDRPFGAPLDIELDLPPPPSANRIWKRAKSGKRQVFTSPEYTAWKRAADGLIGVTAQLRGVQPILGQFEAIVILCERQNKLDLDNSLKSLLDYAKRLCLITDDGPKYLRRVVAEWGDAPHGCRLILRPREPN
jgi:Holliday junction resolvase RusA-like endonuclease